MTAWVTAPPVLAGRAWIGSDAPERETEACRRPGRYRDRMVWKRLTATRRRTSGASIAAPRPKVHVRDLSAAHRDIAAASGQHFPNQNQRI